MSSLERRTPILADLLLRDGGKDPRTAKLLKAQRFVFDASASAFFGTLLNKVSRLVLREHDAARPPFPMTWVEFDANAYAVAIDGFVRDVEDADTAFGLLYDGNTVHLAAASPGGGATFMPMELHLHRRADVDVAVSMLPGWTARTYRMALLGHVETIDHPWWEGPEVGDICASHRLVFPDSLDGKARTILLQSCQGILKQALAALLVLTRPGLRVLSSIDKDRHRTILRGRPQVLQPYRKVTLHIERQVAIRRFVTGIHTGLHRRQHDVRGHWAQTRRRQQACEHVWDAVDTDHFRCLRCEAKRWWRRSHRRGTADQGSVEHEYDVKR